MPLNIQGQVCLVTGASAGIGEACAKALAAEKCTLILLARRLERLEALKEEIFKSYNVSVHCLAMDMSNMSEVRDILSKLPEGAKEVDILVNNAGLALGTSPAQELDLDDAERMLQTNVNGLITMTRQLLPGMVARNRGHIFNISSVAGHFAYGGGSIYCATKYAVRGFTDALRHDVCGTQIRVTAISPGAVQTEFSIVRFGGDKSKADAVYAGIEPLTAEDIADHVHYAATRARHVQIADIVTYATLQSGPKDIARVLPH